MNTKQFINALQDLNKDFTAYKIAIYAIMIERLNSLEYPIDYTAIRTLYAMKFFYGDYTLNQADKYIYSAEFIQDFEELLS